jgi:hypothetical protein
VIVAARPKIPMGVKLVLMDILSAILVRAVMNIVHYAGILYDKYDI